MKLAELETFKKLPLGGVDRRALVALLAERGPQAARELLERQRQVVRPAGTSIAPDTAVLILGGSGGITRAVAMQLLFGERAGVVLVHYDSQRMQIGAHHVRAMAEAASAAGLRADFFNRDATREETVREVIAAIAPRYRAVHLVNGIAAGAPKRYPEHGPTKVPDLDVVFDPVLQVPDYSRPEHIRRVGLVDVDVATAAEIERTNKLMGTSSLLWTDVLGRAGLLAAGESVVAFCDYDYEPDDPVYGMGPLSGAKKLQRQSMDEIRRRHEVRTARVCYPPMATTALGAIPGALLMYALSAQVLAERGEHRELPELAFDTMELWRSAPVELRLDGAYQRALPEIHRRFEALAPQEVPAAFGKLYA